MSAIYNPVQVGLYKVGHKFRRHVTDTGEYSLNICIVVVTPKGRVIESVYSEPSTFYRANGDLYDINEVALEMMEVYRHHVINTLMFGEKLNPSDWIVGDILVTN